jgi:hypothetical protein
MTTTPPVCPSCGVPWVDHLGMTGTRKKLQKALETMRVVREWLDVGGHDLSVAKRSVSKLDKTLEEVG